MQVQGNLILSRKFKGSLKGTITIQETEIKKTATYWDGLSFIVSQTQLNSRWALFFFMTIKVLSFHDTWPCDFSSQRNGKYNKSGNLKISWPLIDITLLCFKKLAIALTYLLKIQKYSQAYQLCHYLPDVHTHVSKPTWSAY